MANINDNIRGKKLFKEGSSKQQAVKGADGEYTVSKEISDDLTSLTDISEVYNDDGLYQVNRFLLKQIEDIRQDVEELHAFIKDAFGKDSSSAASQGAKGDKGDTGAKEILVLQVLKELKVILVRQEQLVHKVQLVLMEVMLL